MKKLNIIVYILVILLTVAAPLGASAQNAEFHRSSAQKAVKTSTDVLLIAAPVATLTGVLIAKDWTGLKQGAFSAVTALGVTYALKYSIHKRRPDGSDFHSFPSGHTAALFTDAAFVQRRYGWKLGIPAYAIAAYVGWGRTFAKKHDWWDVLAGAAIGAGSAYIYTRTYNNKRARLDIAPVADGDNMGLYVRLQF